MKYRDNLYDYLSSRFGKNILFETSEIVSMRGDSARMELSRLVKEKRIKRYTTGVYYIPDPRYKVSANTLKIVEFRYFGSSKEPSGFYIGENYINSLFGLEKSQRNISIVTNKATSGRKFITILKHKVALHKPYAPITADNYELNAFLTYITKASIEDIKKNLTLLTNYVRQAHLSAPDACEILAKFPGKTATRLLNLGFYKNMWRH